MPLPWPVAPGLLVQHRRFDELDQLCQQRLELAADDAEAWHFRGVAAFQRQQYPAAIEYFGHAVRCHPLEPDYANNLGLACQAVGHYDEAKRHLTRAVELRGEIAVHRVNLANVLNVLEDYDAAESLARSAIDREPDYADAWLALGAALSYQSRAQEALRAFEQTLALAPDHFDARRNLAHTRLELGQFDAARDDYEACLQVHPTDGESWYGRVSTERVTASGAAIVERLSTALAQAPDEPFVRSDLHMALGKALDDLERYDEAFEHFALAKQVPHPAFDAGLLRSRIDGWIAAFDRPQMQNAAVETVSGSEALVFIVGMPRSGTTLIEQVLAAHDAVYPSGEVPDLISIMSGHQAPADWTGIDPQAWQAPDPRQLEHWARWYMQRRRDRAPHALRITDKMPANGMFLGLIAQLFPRSRIIHCRRDPLDVGVSIYMQRFGRPPAYAYSLGDIGTFYLEHERLMRHWHDVLPLRMMTLDYERFVAQPNDTTRQLLDFCELPWDDRCLRYYDTPRAVQTASSWQVRQSVHGRSVGRSRHYARHLGELIATLDNATRTPRAAPA